MRAKVGGLTEVQTPFYICFLILLLSILTMARMYVLLLLIALGLLIWRFLFNKPVGAPTLGAGKNPYHDMRGRALSFSAQELGIPTSASDTITYGVILDWHLEHGIATIIAFQTGDASMYLSSGGGILGGSGHPTVVAAARQLVSDAGAFLPLTVPSPDTTLPNPDELTFYLLTPHGRQVGRTTMTEIENGTSPWLPLFEQANHVITTLRQTQPHP